MNDLLLERENNIKEHQKICQNLDFFEENAAKIYKKLNDENNKESLNELSEKLRKYAYRVDDLERQLQNFCTKQNAQILFYLGSTSCFDTKDRNDEKVDYYYIYEKGIPLSEAKVVSDISVPLDCEVDISDLFIDSSKSSDEVTSVDIQIKTFFIDVIIEEMFKTKIYRSWQELLVDIKSIMAMIRDGVPIDSLVESGFKTK